MALHCRLSAHFSLIALTVLMTAAGVWAAPFVSSHGYRLTPALGWKTNTSGMMGSDVIFYTQPADGFAANVNVIVTPPVGKHTLAELQKVSDAQISHMLPQYKQLSRRRLKLDGVPAVETRAVYFLGNPPRKCEMRQITTLKNGRSFSFTCTSLADSYAKYDSAFTSMLNSIHWTK